MNVTRTASAAFTAEFESEEELREEHRTNLSMGGLLLVTAETVALNATLLVTLRGPWAANRSHAPRSWPFSRKGSRSSSTETRTNTSPA
ncbi:MAG TPA: hypothetical protein VGA84_11330 [Thermoanaerobaculia bacterium]